MAPSHEMRMRQLEMESKVKAGLGGKPSFITVIIIVTPIRFGHGLLSPGSFGCTGNKDESQERMEYAGRMGV